MPDLTTSIEMDVPADQVEAAVAQVCAEWGCDRADVSIEVQDGTGRVHLVITLRGENGSVAATEADAAADPGAMAEEYVDQSDPGLALARGTLVELLGKMGIRADVHAGWGETDPTNNERAVVLDVRGDDLGLLIGRKGETLAALQYMTRLIVSKQSGAGVDVVVDVQGHKRRREDQLRRMARRMAEQAAQRQLVMALEPMPANERRIVHLELRDHPSVRTESVGEGTHRKVTIVPK